MQEKQEINDTGADRYRSELEAALPPEMSERKTYQLASRWLKDAGVGGQPDRPNRPTARQQAKGNAECMTADDVDAGYVGRGAPYSHADCAPIATAMRYLAQNRHDTLLVLDQKGAGYIYCDNGSGIWQPNSGLVWHRIARQAMAWGDRGMELVKAKSNEDAAKAIASYQKWLGGPRAWEEIEKSFAAAYRSLQADYPDQIAGLTTCLPEDLDADTSVLGARNGVVDLDTGKLLPRAQGTPQAGHHDRPGRVRPRRRAPTGRGHHRAPARRPADLGMGQRRMEPERPARPAHNRAGRGPPAAARARSPTPSGLPRRPYPRPVRRGPLQHRACGRPAVQRQLPLGAPCRVPQREDRRQQRPGKTGR